jgi:hypothetical protein
MVASSQLFNSQLQPTGFGWLVGQTVKLLLVLPAQLFLSSVLACSIGPCYTVLEQKA